MGWGSRNQAGDSGLIRRMGLCLLHSTFGSHVEFSVCVYIDARMCTYKYDILHTKCICLENFLVLVRLCGAIYSN